jgi:hypothetical protein
MTPGTAAARRKTVSFGDGVVDNEPKQPSKSGLPDDYPGKFPSPWVKSTFEASDGEEPLERNRARNKLIEAYEQGREESSKRTSKSAKQSKEYHDVEVTSDFTNPQSESGQYWKQEYDIYRERTTREVRKLVLKQKAAKSFARDKDIQCTELAEQLRHERRTVERLEKRNAELEAQLREFKEGLPLSQLIASRQAELRPAETQPVYSRSYCDEQNYDRETGQDLLHTYEANVEKSTTTLPNRSRPRPMSHQQSQSWTASTSTSTSERPRPSGAPPPPSHHSSGRAVTSGTEVTPLFALGPVVPPHGVLPQTSTLDLRIPESYVPSSSRQDSAFPSPELPSSYLNGNTKLPAAGAVEALPQGLNTKENLPPTVRVSAPRDDNMLGSAAAAGKRMISKSGQVVGADRLAAAKARLQARGRNVS